MSRDASDCGDVGRGCSQHGTDGSRSAPTMHRSALIKQVPNATSAKAVVPFRS